MFNEYKLINLYLDIHKINKINILKYQNNIKKIHLSIDIVTHKFVVNLHFEQFINCTFYVSFAVVTYHRVTYLCTYSMCVRIVSVYTVIFLVGLFVVVVVFNHNSRSLSENCRALQLCLVLYHN